MDITLDDATKRQFVRDYKLPIQLVQGEYFNYFLNLYQNQYKSMDKYNLLQKTIQHFGSVENFLKESYKVKDAVMDFVKSQESFLVLKNDKLDAFQSKYGTKTNLYNHLNVGKTFVSIDLVKGNFQSLNYYDKNILDNSKDYDEFISKFTDQKYFKESKQIRQVIFGNLEPKKQQRIQKKIMETIKSVLVESGLPEDAIKATSPDELVFELKFFPDYELLLKNSKIKDFDLHIEVFELENIKPTISCFIKRFKNKDGYEIKSGNAKYMPEVIKFLENKKLEKMDLAFFDEGRIAFYKEPLILTKEETKNEY